ncbi:hypothetical protein Ocin01_15959 [Orchesella cincta]|uniref:EGF-like domain-containing protein n=1 Tax=Orchesella cincta TaxID=48709 RepID=A0A1D2MCM7_ORCCI|nr:hypothetical protein Ocin01_15959 [Orchesella cincta]
MFRPSSFIITVLILDVGNLVSPFGVVDYYDDCEFETLDYSTYNSRFDESKFCDTARGLYCVPGLGKCGCIVPHTIYRTGKCRSKVGNSCLAPGNVRLDCVEHARCTTNNTSSSTFKCQCIRGYLSNAMKTACFPTDYYSDRRRNRDRYGNPYWNVATGLPSQRLSIIITFGIVSVNVIRFS